MKKKVDMVCFMAALWTLLPQALWSATPIEKCFQVDWLEIQYGKSVRMPNPRLLPQRPANQRSETLRLTCRIEVTDPDRVIGICSDATITDVRDSQGRDVSLPSPAQPAGIQYYRGLTYRREPFRPVPLPRWRQILQSILRIRQPASARSEMVWVLQPERISLKLDTLVRPSAEKEIGRLEGYFYALTADSVEYVDVPFEPNSSWIRLTPSQEIRVLEAQCTSASYQFRTEARSQSSVELGPADALPARLVIDRQLLGADGTLVHRVGRFSVFPARLGRRESAFRSGSIPPVKTIRYVIAVDPKHSRIPFVLEHIPLPQP